MGKVKTKQELIDLKAKARELIEMQGLQQKIVAEVIGISEKTICNWIIRHKWKKKSEMLTKRNEARQLVIKQGFHQKEAAQMLSVSEKTISTWSLKYKWKSEKVKQANADVGLKAFIKGFKQYLLLHYESKYDKISKIADAFYSTYSGKQ
jgi:transposase